jgi:regulatory protein YycH of two-component signal transduction system YycFG
MEGFIMKKYIIICTLLISIVCAAQAFGFRLDVEPVSGMTGESVTIPVKLIDIDQAMDIDAIGFTLIFDDSQLTYVEAQNDNTLTKDFQLLAGKEIESGQIKVLGANFDHAVRVTEDSILVNIVFTIKNNISTPCSFSVFDLLDDIDPKSQIQGDFNHDRHLSLIDVIIALQWLAGLLPQQ